MKFNAETLLITLASIFILGSVIATFTNPNQMFSKPIVAEKILKNNKYIVKKYIGYIWSDCGNGYWYKDRFIVEKDSTTKTVTVCQSLFNNSVVKEITE